MAATLRRQRVEQISLDLLRGRQRQRVAGQRARLGGAEIADRLRAPIGIAAGVMLKSVRPRPTSSPSSAGSDAISPHSDTGDAMARRRAPHQPNQPQHRRVQRLVESETRSSVRSTARQY